MTDYPPGNFTILIIGPYWPSGASVISTVNAARNRGTVKSIFDDYGRQLLTTRTGPLAPMEGVTAQSLQDLFKIGEAHATSVSDKNGVKQRSFSDAADALNGLRSALTHIAAEGNAKIDEIMQSKKNAIQKLSEIVDVIAEKQGEAENNQPNMVPRLLLRSRMCSRQTEIPGRLSSSLPTVASISPVHPHRLTRTHSADL